MDIANPYAVPAGEPPAAPCAAVNGFSVVQRRLMGLERLAAADLAWVQALESLALSYEPRTDVIVEGEEPGPLYMQAEGWAYRYRLIEDGRRQILDFVLPGDWYDLTASPDQPYTASVGTLTACKAAATPPGFKQSCARTYPNLLDSIEVMRGEAVRRLEQSVTMLGRLTAAEAMLMFLSRTFDRLEAVGLVEGDAAELPLTQEMIGDHLGLSTVHVNRTLKVLKEEWGIRIADGVLAIPDPDAVRAEVCTTDAPAGRLAC
jgi:CRP-like cAMP-binding protein